MKIPDKVKVGGRVYDVEITNDLYLGRASYSAEVDYIELKIRISNSAEQKMKTDFMHELLHAVCDHLGYKDHDEQKIDSLANALYMVIEDNPQIFKEEKQ